MKFTLRLVVALFALVCWVSSALASSSPCPTAVSDPTGSRPSGIPNTAYESDVSGGANPCNIQITFNADGSITTTTTGMAADPYDGQEDQLVGIINNSPNTITSIMLSNPVVSPFGPIFGFDGDGICAYQPFITNPSGPNVCNADPSLLSQDYLGSAISFSGINATETSGFVNFAGTFTGLSGTFTSSGIAPGSSGYFSLEAPASLNLQVSPTPEPSSLLLLGSGLFGLVGALKRRIPS